MIQDLLTRDEGKTLEFKANATSLFGIVKTVAAFANTAGGTIVVGVEDKTKRVIGLEDPLEDETRIINKISESITPFFIPNIEIQTYREKALILIEVPYGVGPYYIKTTSGDGTVYVRFGSTNRIADSEMILTMKSLAKNVTFDEAVCPHATLNDVDVQRAHACFSSVNKSFDKNKAMNLGLFTTLSGAERPSNGGILLFGKDRSRFFPDAVIRCVRFAGTKKEESLDHLEINTYLPDAIDNVLHFIAKNTFTRSMIGPKRRVDIPQYPIIAVREAVINAIVHADYSIQGSSIIVAIFDDRLEITNPGTVPYGLSLEDALAGSSRVRNRVIARTFHLLNLIEQWGSGLQKIIQTCVKNGLKAPKFEEIGTQFRVTLYSEPGQKTSTGTANEDFIKHVREAGELSAKEAAQMWRIDVRSARRRLKKLVEQGVLVRLGTSKHDPYGKYIAHKR